MINYITRIFDHGNDLVETLRTLKIQNIDKWMPTLKMSIAKDQELVKRGNRQFELEYKAKLSTKHVQGISVFMGKMQSRHAK